VKRIDATRRTPWTAVGVAAALALSANGCGGGDDFANEPRPPVPITVGTTIAPARVSVSPERFGAGPIELIASNQTAISQRVTLRSESLIEGAAPLEQRTGPINPGDTASLKATLSQGTYEVTALSNAIAPATIRVGPARKGAQDQLLQP